MIKEEIKRLFKSVFLLSKRNESNLFSFWSGYFFDKKDTEKQVCRLIGNYLQDTYQIESNLTTWIEQVDHYAFIKKVDWIDGLYKLLDEILKYKGDLPMLPSRNTPLTFVKTPPPSAILEEIITETGIKIKKGTVIKLNNRIGRDYLYTKYYDVHLKNPSWELFYPAEKDYKAVCFLYSDQENKLEKVTYGNVWRIFSDFNDQVTSIEWRAEKYYLQTQIFEIELPLALKNKEISITSHEGIPQHFQSLISGLNDSIELLRSDLAFDDGFNLSQFVADHFLYFKKDWQNYRRHFSSSIGRNWVENKLNEQPQ